MNPALNPEDFVDSWARKEMNWHLRNEGRQRSSSGAVLTEIRFWFGDDDTRHDWFSRKFYRTAEYADHLLVYLRQLQSDPSTAFKPGKDIANHFIARVESSAEFKVWLNRRLESIPVRVVNALIEGEEDIDLDQFISGCAQPWYAKHLGDRSAYFFRPNPGAGPTEAFEVPGQSEAEMNQMVEFFNWVQKNRDPFDSPHSNWRSFGGKMWYDSVCDRYYKVWCRDRERRVAQ